MSILAPDVQSDAELPLLEATQPVAPPFVNLLPPEIGERRALRQLVKVLALVVVVVLALTGALVLHAGSGKAEAKTALAAQQAQTSRLQQQVRGLSSARAAQTQLQAAKAALRAAMANEVLWSQYLDQLRGQLPDGVRFSELQIAPVGAAAAGVTGSSASAPTTPGSGVTPNAVATLTITGKAVSQDAVANWLDALGKVKGFTNAYLTDTASADSASAVLTFTVTVDVTPDALSHRFDSAGS